MRRIALLSLAVLVAGACQDQPTGPVALAPDESAAYGQAPHTVRGPTAAPILYVATAARSLGFTLGDAHRYQNLPEPDLSGDRVVWRSAASAYGGPVEVYLSSFSTGARTQLAGGEVGNPRTSARYTVWQEGVSAIRVLDHTTGQSRRVEGQFPMAASANIVGDRMVFMDVHARTIELYDLATGARRTLATYGGGPEARYYHVRAVGFDGRYAAWISDGGAGQSGLGMALYDTQTGQERMIIPFGQGRMTGPSMEAGRIAYSMDVGDRHAVFLLDIATGQSRQLSANAPRAQQNPRISGDLVVWEDTRQDSGPYIFNHDVYLYDLRTGMEMPLANGPEWTSGPRVDGSRVIWTERRNNRWEIMATELAPASVAVLRAELGRAVQSGAVRTAGLAQSLEKFLAQAASAQSAGNHARAEHWLRQFAGHVRRHAGRQIEAAVAQRLEGIAAGAIARL